MFLAGDMIDGGTILLSLFMMGAIVAACAALIYCSLWVTTKVGGSKALVWGAMLGVTTANSLPLLGVLLGHWADASFLIRSFLPSAVAASALACFINLIIWQRNKRIAASEVVEGPELEP